TNGVDLNNSAVDRIRAGDLAGHPNGKENGTEVAFPHARNVDAPGSATRPQVEFAVKKALRRVVVRVHDDGPEVQPACPFRNPIRFHCTRQEHARGNACGRAPTRSHHVTSPWSPIEQPASLCLSFPTAPSREECCRRESCAAALP